MTSTIDGREQRPVVHITVIDALAFAAWEGKDLPTDLEWEAAARSGLGEPGYTWRDECIRGRQSDAHGSLIVRNAMGKSDTVGSICEWTAGWYPPRVTDGLASVGGMQGMLGLPDIDLRSPQDPTLRSRREQPNAGPACALSEDDPAMLTARFPEATDPSVWRMGFRCVLRPELGESEPS